MTNHLQVKTSITTSVETVKVSHSTSSVPASGFGIKALFEADDSTMQNVEIGMCKFWWENSIHSVRTSGLEASIIINGESVEVVKTDGDKIGVLTSNGWVWYELPQGKTK